jgi:[protein-PII] uridylyltransferase
MRDYYTHTRHLWQHGNSLMEIFNLESIDQAHSGLRSFLSFRRKKTEAFDGFSSREGRIWLSSVHLFQQDSHAMMRVFQHTQQRHLKLSPPIRKMLRSQLHLVDRNFQYSTANRETFQAILERKGDVAHSLRQMHRVGFLGAYLPEFGALDCLVQHEFFHRYTADEHTLRCIDKLDLLIAEEKPRTAFYRKLFLDIEDPYAIYLAFILHDAGRAEDVREHTDGSMMLANQICKRLRITGSRRALIMFLVDNHLLFWLTATTRNLEEPEVIAEFAAIMKTPENLDALMLFTYCDSNGTSPDAWTGWKESLMRQLHSLTSRFLRDGRSAYEAALEESKNELRTAVLAEMRQDYHPWINEHFDRMPSTSFGFKQPKQIIPQIRTVRHFFKREESSQTPYCMKWIDFSDKGYSELIVATRNRRNLLEKLCCALASEQINILSADFHTRTDGIVVNLFRVCDTSFQPIADPAMRKRFQTTFDHIFDAEEYDSSKYLKRKRNFLAPRSDEGIAFPVRTLISNEPHSYATRIDIQALDRIGLLHDLFHTVNLHHLDTVHARICTEKGAAVDTLYITHPGGAKVTDPQLIEKLLKDLDAVISRQD